MRRNVPRTPNSGFVVLDRLENELWGSFGEVERRRDLPGREARSQAVFDATRGRADQGGAYAASRGANGTLRWMGPSRRAEPGKGLGRSTRLARWPLTPRPEAED